MTVGAIALSETEILRNKILDCALRISDVFDEDRGGCYTPLLAMIEYCARLKRLELHNALELPGLYP